MKGGVHPVFKKAPPGSTIGSQPQFATIIPPKPKPSKPLGTKDLPVSGQFPRNPREIPGNSRKFPEVPRIPGKFPTFPSQGKGREVKGSEEKRREVCHFFDDRRKRTAPVSRPVLGRVKTTGTTGNTGNTGNGVPQATVQYAGVRWRTGTSRNYS